MPGVLIHMPPLSSALDGQSEIGIEMDINDLIKKSQNGEQLFHKELVHLLSLAPDSPESYLIMAEANRISKELTGNKAEVHAQLALNLAPCPCNCAFCAFAQKNGVFSKKSS